MKKLFLSIVGFAMLASLPSMASALSAPSVSVDRVQHWNARVQWTTVTGATRYVVKVYKPNGNLKTKKVVSGSKTFQHVKNLKPNKRYTVKVRAKRGSLKSSFTARRFTTKKASTGGNGLYTYRNKRLGVRFDVPRENDSTSGPVRMIEEKRAVVVSKVKKRKNRYYKRRAQGKSAERAARGSSWAVVAKNARGRKAVKNFVKKRYGSGCRVTGFSDTGRGDTQAVTVEGDGLDIFNTRCNTNFVFYVYYSDRHNRVASFDIGQSTNFVVDGDAKDYDMARSFRFMSRD
jgi:hypothetical protein